MGKSALEPYLISRERSQVPLPSGAGQIRTPHQMSLQKAGKCIEQKDLVLLKKKSLVFFCIPSGGRVLSGRGISQPVADGRVSLGELLITFEPQLLSAKGHGIPLPARLKDETGSQECLVHACCPGVGTRQRLAPSHMAKL